MNMRINIPAFTTAVGKILSLGEQYIHTLFNVPTTNQSTVHGCSPWGLSELVRHTYKVEGGVIGSSLGQAKAASGGGLHPSSHGIIAGDPSIKLLQTISSSPFSNHLPYMQLG